MSKKCISNTIIEHALFVNKIVRQDSDNRLFFPRNSSNKTNNIEAARKLTIALQKKFDNNSISIGNTTDYGTYIEIHPSNVLIKKFNDKQRLEQLKTQMTEHKFREDTGNWTVKEGDVLPKDNVEVDFLPSIKDIKEERYKPVVKTLKNQYKQFDNKLTAVKNNLRNAVNKSDIKKYVRQKEILEKELKSLESEIENALKISKLEDLRGYAENHIEKVTSLINDDMSFEEINEATRYIKLWQSIGDFSSNNPFFTDIELKNNSLKYGYIHPVSKEKVSGFADYKNQMDELSRELTDITKNKVLSQVNKTLDTDYTVDDVFGALKDIDSLTANFRDLGTTGDPLAVAIWKMTKGASFQAEKEISSIFENIDEMTKKVIPILKRYKKPNGDIWDFFKQVDKNGKETGGYVMHISQDYWNELKNQASNFKKLDPSDKGYKRALENYLQWKKDNEIMFDPRILFPTSSNDSYHYAHSYTDKHKEDLLKKLKNNMSKQQFDMMYSKAEERVNDFKKIYDVKKYELSEEELDIWDKENSPYYAAKSVIDKEPIRSGNEFIKPLGTKDLTSTPKKYNDKGNLTGWVDPKYEEIMKNPDLSKFYLEFTKLMNELSNILPDNIKKDMRVNTIPTIMKSVMEEISSTGLRGGFTKVNEKLINGIRVNNLSDQVYTQTDAFGNIEKSPQLHIADNKKLVNDALRLKIIKYKSENNTPPDTDTLKKMRADVMDELSKSKSWDLGNVLKAYAAQAYSYKHKSKLEDILRISVQLMKQRQKLEVNTLNKVLKDADGSPIQLNESADRLISVLENTIDNFYGISTRKVEGVLKEKKLTPKEKKELEILNEGIVQINNDLTSLEESFKNKKIGRSKFQKESEKLNNQRKGIEKQIELLGGSVTASKLADNIMQWVQLKTMAYNIPSAFANLMFGDLANLMIASDGRMFTLKDFYKARRLVMSSHLKLARIPTDTGMKISNWMKALDIHKQASQEIKDPTKKIVSKKVKIATPYGLQEASEYMVYAPILVAMMNNTKIINEAGEESTLWDKAGINGTIESGWKVKSSGKKIDSDFLINFKIKIDHLIKKNHGNYDSGAPLNIKNITIGKLLSQFRSWMFEGIASRFEKEDRDDVLGITVKGRWRSYSLLTKPKNILFTLKQLLRKITLAGVIYDRGNSTTQFDSQFTEVDAANMRANMNELMVLMGVFMGAALLKGLNGDNEDDQMGTLNFLINQMGRLQTDILLYANPNELEKIQANIIPASLVINDIGRWFNSIYMFIEGNDELKGGPDKGDSRLFRETLKMTPIGSSYLKNKRSIETTFD